MEMCIHIYTHTCICICVYMYKYVYICIDIWLCVRIYIYVCICIYIYVYIYMYIYVYICIYIYVYVYTYMYVFTYIYVHTQRWCRETRVSVAGCREAPAELLRLPRLGRVESCNGARATPSTWGGETYCRGLTVYGNNITASYSECNYSIRYFSYTRQCTALEGSSTPGPLCGPLPEIRSVPAMWFRRFGGPFCRSALTCRPGHQRDGQRLVQDSANKVECCQPSVIPAILRPSRSLLIW